MRTQSKVWSGIVGSVAISIAIVFFASSVLRDIDRELKRDKQYDEIINKAFALNILIAMLKDGSNRHDISQARNVQKSLSSLLEGVSSSDPEEESFLRQIRRNNRELSPLLEHFFTQTTESDSAFAAERRNMLASQLWVKARFITDDTYRLMEIGRDRIISDHFKAGISVLALIVILILANAGISFFSGRSIVRAEEEAREQREWLSVTLNSIGDAVIATDETGRITFINPVAAVLTGWREDEAHGRMIEEVFSIINEQTRKPAEDIVRRVLRDGLVAGLANHTSLVARDGREIPIEDSAAPIKGQAGELRGVVLVFHDVTETRRAREQIERLARFPSENPNPVLRVSLEGELLYANRSSADLLDYLDWRIDEQLPDYWRQYALGVIEGGSEREIEATCGEMVYSLLFAPVMDLGYLNIYGRDITGHKRADEALLKAHDELEIRVLERTAELAKVNADLVVEVEERKRAEQSAIEERQRFFGVLETLPAYVCLLTPDYHVPFANRVFRDRFGESRGLRCFEHLFGRSEPCEVCDTYTVLKTGESHEWEWTGPDNRGYQVFDFPFTDTDGSTLILEMGIDITARKQAEEALREINETLEQRVAERTAELVSSEEMLKRSQEIAHLGSWELDLATNRLSWSDEVYRIFGLQPREFAATYEAFLDAVHPDDRAAVDAAYLESLSEGRDSYEIEHRVVRKSDGEVRIVHEKCGHFRDESGRIIRSAGMVHDITERKLMEEELRRSRNELELRVQERTIELARSATILRDQAALLDLAHDAILVRSLDDRISFWNKGAEETYGYTRQEALGARTSDLLKSRPGAPMEEIERAVLSRGAWTGELQHKRAGGEEIVVDSRWALQTGADGAPIGFLEINRNISARKRAEEKLTAYTARLELMNRELADFAFIASHDLQEPLRKIQTFGHMLDKKYRDSFGPEGRDYMERMIKSANRMSDLLRSLLYYSQIGAEELSCRPTDLTQAAREAVSDLEVLIRKANGRVEIGDLPTVEANPFQMRQLLQNLIGNSIKYLRDCEPPAVKITGSASGGICRVVVEDNGIGFGQEYSEKIFKPFERLHGKNDKYGGTGMGLAICRKIVVRHGGEITVTSSPGKGTTFVVSLPLKQTDGKGA